MLIWKFQQFFFHIEGILLEYYFQVFLDYSNKIVFVLNLNSNMKLLAADAHFFINFIFKI